MERWKRRTRRGLALGTLAALGFLVSLVFTGIVLATDTSTSGSTATTTDSTPTTTETTPTTTETTPTTTTQPPGGEGCTPGFWKNHPEAWVGFTTGQTLESVFNVPDALGLDNVSLLNALSLPGGSGTQGGAQILLRAAVAALLNSAHPNLDYFMSTAGVINAVNAALASGDRDTMLALASLLDSENNRGCDLG